MRLIFSLFLSFFLLIFSLKPAYATYEPSTVSNNLYGIHIIDSSDLEDAAKLVNSGGGDWGYVTFVIQQTQRDSNFWQGFFDKARRLHLIPIVRIATRPIGEVWEKPSFGDIDGWVSFLNSLNWVVTNRYVIIGNEPNHAKEWGGEVNPEEYASFANEFAEKLKGSSPNFFIMLSGMDASASNSKITMDESVFLKRMLKAKPNLFNNIDGWASHSYPNPGFSGDENASGRGTVRTYDWEESLIKSLGVEKNLPIFVTETGWAHAMNGENKKAVDTAKIGERLIFTFSNVWSDKRIVAVTPFVLSYKEDPFDTFSWKDKNGNFYQFYFDIQKLAKTRGAPLQDDKAKFLSIFVSPFHLTGSFYSGVVHIKNEGQAIWNKDELALTPEKGTTYELTSHSFDILEPGQTGFLTFRTSSPYETGNLVKTILLKRNGTAISGTSHFQIITFSPPKVKLDTFFATILRLFKGL